jgi:ABC-type ATPase with predicted acetyltransferase domain
MQSENIKVGKKIGYIITTDIRGLCHKCFSSNIDIVEIYDGMPICLSCLVLEKVSQ